MYSTIEGGPRIMSEEMIAVERKEVIALYMSLR